MSERYRYIGQELMQVVEGAIQQHLEDNPLGEDDPRLKELTERIETLEETDNDCEKLKQMLIEQEEITVELAKNIAALENKVAMLVVELNGKFDSVNNRLNSVNADNDDCERRLNKLEAKAAPKSGRMIYLRKLFKRS